MRSKGKLAWKNACVFVFVRHHISSEESYKYEAVLVLVSVSAIMS